MDLWRLRVFQKVVETGGFSLAGRELRLSQPTVSGHIRDLEDHFGCRLIDRLTREVVPTPAGRLLHEHARRILDLAEAAEAALAAFQGELRGRLIVGGSSIPGTHYLPARIGAFVRRHAGVKASLVIGDTREMTDRVLDGHLELAVVGARTDHRHLEQIPLLEDELWLVTSPDHEWAGRDAITPDMLDRVPFVSRESGSGTLASLHRLLEEHGISMEKWNVVAEMGNTGAVVAAVKAGLGVSLVSCLAVADEVAAGRLARVAVSDLPLRRWFYLTTHGGRTLSPLASAFADGLREPVEETSPSVVSS